MTTDISPKQKNKRLAFIEKLFAIPISIFGLSFILLLAYTIITNFAWKSFLIVIVAIAGVAAFGFSLEFLEHFFKYIYKSSINAKEKKDIAMGYIGVAIITILCLVASFIIWIGFIQEIHKRASYKTISNKEVIEQLKKSKEKINSALVSMDISLGALTASKDNIDAVIYQVVSNKETFLNQIAKLNEAEEIAKNTDAEVKENERMLNNIQTILEGKRILTVGEFEKNKKIDLIIAFFLGIATSLIAYFITNIRREKRAGA